VAEAKVLKDEVPPVLVPGPPAPTVTAYGVEAVTGPTYIAPPPPPPPPQYQFKAGLTPLPPPPPTTVTLICVVVAGVVNVPGAVNTVMLEKPPAAADLKDGNTPGPLDVKT
jgi:hypothetical protein